MIVTDKAGNVVHSDTWGEGPESRPEIDRNQLTNQPPAILHSKRTHLLEQQSPIRQA
jgi:hypothetical protein